MNADQRSRAHHRQDSTCAYRGSQSGQWYAQVWLDIPQRVQYKLGVIVHQCLQNKAPQYIVDCCKRTSDVSSRQRLRSANRYQLIVPRQRRSMFGRRAFSVAGPMEWNSLPDSLRDPARSTTVMHSSSGFTDFCLSGAYSSCSPP